jgi:polyhydroxyalkanoate synthase
MFPFKMTPDQAVQELLEFNKNLAEGLNTLTKIDKVETGTTAKEAVYREDKLVLYRYKPQVAHPNPTPLLIVYALVNRPDIIDLQPERSLVKNLLEMGQDVYLIDWGYPDKSDRYLTLEDYIHGYLHRCVKMISRRHSIEKINLLGICQGGVFSLCYSALYRERVNALITMVTPVDFKTPDNLLSHWLQKLDIDLLVDTLGNIPGELLNWTFLSLKPFRLTGQKYLDMIDNLNETKTAENFLRMEKWIFDSPDQAGEAFRQFVTHFFQKNGLIHGKIFLGEHKVDLKSLTLPILNIYATEDHIVPPSASQALKTCIGSQDYTEIPFQSGHIGIYVSHRAQNEIPVQISQWLEKYNK